MDIVFVGTGAADWPHQPPHTHLRARRMAGFTAALFAGNVLVDCGPTVPAALARLGIDPAAITELLITHGHGDHYCLEAIATVAKAGGVRVHADPVLLAELSEIEGVQACPLVVGEPIQLGSLQATPLLANHTLDRPGEQAYHYLLADRDTTLFYATDGAWLPKQTWLALRQEHLDGIVWEATCGDTEGDWRIFEHNSITMVRVMRETFIKQGLLAPDAPVWLTHLARTLCSPHHQLADTLAPEGLALAYDGLRACLPVPKLGSSGR